MVLILAKGFLMFASPIDTFLWAAARGSFEYLKRNQFNVVIVLLLKR